MKAQSMRVRLAETPLAVRIAVFIGVFGLLVVGAASVAGYRALARQLDARVGVELTGKRELVRHVLSEIAEVAQIADSAHRLADLLIGHDDLHLAVVETRNGRVLASFSRAGRASADRRMAEGAALSYWQGADGVRYASLDGEGRLRDGGVVRIVLSQDLRGDELLLAGFTRGIGFALPVVLLVIAAGAWLVARTGLQIGRAHV